MAPPTRRQSSRGKNNDDLDPAPRKKVQTKGKTEKLVSKDKDQWVCVLNNELVDASSDVKKCASVYKLKHPRTNIAALFLMPPGDTKVFQFFNFKENYRSWFIGERVHSDGSLYMTSPIDPLFLILPYLMNSTEVKRFTPLDQLLCDEHFPDCFHLTQACSSQQVALVCDCKDIDDDLKVYRYNKEKTLSWLKKKTEALADALEARNIHVSSKSSHSSMFVRSKTAATSKASYMEFAHGMISDFLCLELEEELKTHLGISKDCKENVEDGLKEEEPPSKKAKLCGDIAPTDDYSVGVDMKKSKKNVKLTNAQKQLSKVDKTGMKSISSFFSPK